MFFEGIGSPTFSVVDSTIRVPLTTVTSKFGFDTVAVRTYSPAPSTILAGFVTVIPIISRLVKPST